MSKKFIKYAIMSDDTSGISHRCRPNNTYEIIGEFGDWYSVWASGTMVFILKSLEGSRYTTTVKTLLENTTYYERS